ncbi:MAG TPA: class I SAM-dependent methyltransferase [Actinomycetota bacterium]|nr:class I SAM-dependent methyltransferase [Actinomycetota bacterium]
MSDVASVSFDRAVEYYDRTRALPEAMMTKVVETLASDLQGRGGCLEVGVGTGRMALPLHSAGVAITGLDLSPRMLARLVEKAGGEAPFPVVVGDALRLPFADHSFGAALAVHVLHLIPDWETAVQELVRAVRPGGEVLIDVGGLGSGWWAEVQRRFCAEVGLSERYLGTHRAADVDGAMTRLGLSARRLPPITGHETATAEERIRRLEEGLYSFTWRVEERARRKAAAAVRRWASEALGALDHPRPVSMEVSYRAYDVPDR